MELLLNLICQLRNSYRSPYLPNVQDCVFLTPGFAPSERKSKYVTIIVELRLLDWMILLSFNQSIVTKKDSHMVTKKLLGRANLLWSPGQSCPYLKLRQLLHYRLLQPAATADPQSSSSSSPVAKTC